MAEVGYATLGIIPSFDGFERNLTQGTTGPMASVGGSAGTRFGDAAGKTAGKRFGGAFKTAAKAGLIGIGALGVGAFKLAGDAVSAASDLEESTNKVRQVFGGAADDVLRFSSKAADALGQTNVAARDAAATFGLFGNLAGLSEKKSAKFSTRMATLASDLASFHNTEPDQAVEALGAALRGESEPIRSFGVLLDEATLKAEAMRLGLLKPVKDQAKIESYQVKVMEGQKGVNDALKEFGPKSLEALKAQSALGMAQDQLQKATEGTIPPLTQQQKVLAAQSSIFKQTEVAQGDFARTSDGLANQQRRLRARFEDAKASLGTGLLPIMTDAADFLLDKGIPAFERFSDWFTKTGLPAVKDFGGDVKDAWRQVKTLVDRIGDLPDSVKLGGAFAGVGTGLAARKGLQGAAGFLGKNRGATPANPLYVFATNGGVGGGGAGGAGGGKTGGGSKVGKVPAIIGKFGVAGAVLLTAGVGLKELYDFHRPEGSGGLKSLGGGGINDWFKRQMYDDGPVIAPDAFDKVRSSAMDAQTSAESADAKWKDFFGTLDRGTKRERHVKVKSPDLLEMLDRLNRFDKVLDDVDGRVVRVHIRSVQDNNVVSDIGGNGGKTPAGLGRATVNDNRIIVHGGIRPRNFDETERDLRRKQRTRAGGGR